MVDVITPTVIEAIKRLFNIAEAKAKEIKLDRKKIEVNLDLHIRMVESWSSQIQHYGMPSALETSNCTIPLSITVGARRFRPLRGDAASVDEATLIHSRFSYVILGDPGSGKTTTLKRIAQELLHAVPVSQDDAAQYPILLTSRRSSTINGLLAGIADALGLPMRILYRTLSDGKVHVEVPLVTIVENPLAPENEQRTVKSPAPHVKVAMIGDEPAIEFICNFVDGSGAVVLVDGLDEFPQGARITIETEMVELSSLLRVGKIIATCRSGDFVRSMDGFDLVEIQPLQGNDVSQIVSLWTKKQSKQFEAEINSRAYRDLATRPLFLVNLLLLYSMGGYLPEKSVDVYRRLTLLLLEKWDEQRGVRRTSKYANFLPDRKKDFLAEVAWELTYLRQTKAFSTEVLSSVCASIAPKYQLPPSDWAGIASEIESHTGIMVAGGFETYEFSHLTLQEYLAADFIVRQPYIRNFETIFNVSSAPFAVAVALSSDPSRWFANLVLRNMMRMSAKGNWNDGVYSFLSRLAVEKVALLPSEQVGAAILGLESVCFLSNRGSFEGHRFDEFVKEMGVFDGLCLAIRWYKTIGPLQSSDDFVELKLESDLLFEIPMPGRLYVREELLVRLVDANRRQGAQKKINY